MCILYLYVFISILQFALCESNSACSYNFPLVTDFGPENCADGTFYVKNYGVAPNDCFPACVQYASINESCSDEIKCAPGLKCVENDDDPPIDICKVDADSCFKYKHLDLPPEIWRPKCLPDGTYEPKQCKGETDNGRCFCFDAYGKRIFGQQWSDQATEMTCACSRRRSELQSAGRTTDVTLHCDSVGNYEPLQCDSGLCWCAEPKTGKVLESVVPDSMMTFLPCYKVSEVGEQYLRQCESQAAGQAKILSELKIHGTVEASLPFLICDGDGSYGKYRIDKGIAYCTKRDNSNTVLGNSEIVANMMETLNCNCALDHFLYEEAGLPLNLICEGNGNYKKVQMDTKGNFYCVDSDGFSTTIPTDQVVRPDECPNL